MKPNTCALQPSAYSLCNASSRGWPLWEVWRLTSILSRAGADSWWQFWPILGLLSGTQTLARFLMEVRGIMKYKYIYSRRSSWANEIKGHLKKKKFAKVKHSSNTMPFIPLRPVQFGAGGVEIQEEHFNSHWKMRKPLRDKICVCVTEASGWWWWRAWLWSHMVWVQSPLCR